jgi:hypothetical protein
MFQTGLSAFNSCAGRSRRGNQAAKPLAVA